jgi:hypothetical protein
MDCLNFQKFFKSQSPKYFKKSTYIAHPTGLTYCGPTSTFTVFPPAPGRGKVRTCPPSLGSFSKRCISSDLSLRNAEVETPDIPPPMIATFLSATSSALIGRDKRRKSE